MSRIACKIIDDEGKELYFIWSTIVDAPITYLCSLEEFENFWEKEYGRQGLKDLRREYLHHADERCRNDSQPYKNYVTREYILKNFRCK